MTWPTASPIASSPCSGLRVRRVAATILFQIFFRRLEQFFTLAGPFVGQQRVATHDPSFTWKMFLVGDLRQILFVEQRPVDFARLHQRSNAFRAQCRNLFEPSHVSQIFVDAFRRDHAAIAHEHHIRDAESLANFRDDASERFRVCRVPGEYLDGNWTRFRIRQQTAHDLRPNPAMIATVAVRDETRSFSV